MGKDAHRASAVAPCRASQHHHLERGQRGVIELSEGTAELLGVSVVPVHGVGGTHHPDVDRWITGCEEALTRAEDMTALTGRAGAEPGDHVRFFRDHSRPTGDRNARAEATPAARGL